MVTMTVFVDSDTFCWVINILNKSFVLENEEESNIKLVSTGKSKKYPIEIQVPVQIVVHFTKDDMAKIDLLLLQTLNS